MLLKTFTPDEFKQFGDYVESPLYNSSKKVVELYRLLGKSYPSFTKEEVDQLKVFRAMFKGKQYSSMQVLYNLSNKLFELAKGFAAHCMYKTSIQQDLLLLNYLFVRDKRGALFQSLLPSISKEVESMEMGVEYFYAHWIYEKGKEMQTQHQHLFKRKKILTDIENWHSIDQAGNLYLVNLMNYITSFYRLRKDFNAELPHPYHFSFVEKLYESLQERVHPFVTLEFHRLKLTHYQRDEDFFALKEVVFHMEFEVSKVVKYNMFTTLMNYCNAKSAKDSYFSEQYLAVTTQAIAVDAYLIPINKQRAIEPGLFMNYVRHCIRLKRLTTAEEFIEKHREQVWDKYRTSAYHYTKAQLAFARKDFEQVYVHLQEIQVNEADFFYMLTAILRALLYYELKEWLLLEPHLEAMRQYLMKHQSNTTKGLLIGRKHFIVLLRRLMNLHHQCSRKRLNRFKEKLSAAQVVNKDWLAEKLEAFEKEFRGK
jgi:hypothetical protein